MRTKNNFNVNYDFCNYMKKVNYISFDKIQFDREKIGPQYDQNSTEIG